MCEVPVFYATTEGQTRRIAERFAAQLRELALDSRAIAIGSADAGAIDWTAGARRLSRGIAAPPAPPARSGGLRDALSPRALGRAVAVHLGESVGGVEERERSASGGEARRGIRCSRAGWTPWKVAAVGGRLAYTQIQLGRPLDDAADCAERGRVGRHEPRPRVHQLGRGHAAGRSPGVSGAAARIFSCGHPPADESGMTWRATEGRRKKLIAAVFVRRCTTL